MFQCCRPRDTEVAERWILLCGPLKVLMPLAVDSACYQQAAYPSNEEHYAYSLSRYFF